VDLSTARGQAWSKFLQLEKIKNELDKEQPDLAMLVDLHMNMKQNYLGLEYAPFVNVRDDLADVARALRYGYDPDRIVAQLGDKLQQLYDNLNEPLGDTERSYSVGLIANYLNEAGQAPEAIAEIHQLFSKPNVQLYARESVLNRWLARPVAQPSPVNECILGTRVIGQACLSGNVSADVTPMNGGVALNLNLSATMNSDNRGYNRGVVLLSSGSSPVFASKHIVITPQGASASPAFVSTDLSTSIYSIQHRSKLVRRIATKKAAEQKAQAESIAEGRMQRKLRTGYDEQVDQQLAEANVKFATLQRDPPPELPRLGLSRPKWGIHSTSSTVHGEVIQAAAFQLSTQAACSMPKPATSEIVVEAHQSAIMNALDVVVGDRTIRSADLDDYARQATGEVPEDLQKEADGESWSITMATYRPVEIEFDDNLVKFRLRITRMTRGDQSLDDAALITAVYAPSYADGVVTLDRQGDVEINFPRASRGLRAVTLRSFLKGKFDAFFKEQIVTKPIDLSKSFPNAPNLDVDSIQLDDGWVQVGMR
jgi:hypothetical protein